MQNDKWISVISYISWVRCDNTRGDIVLCIALLLCDSTCRVDAYNLLEMTHRLGFNSSPPIHSVQHSLLRHTRWYPLNSSYWDLLGTHDVACSWKSFLLVHLVVEQLHMYDVIFCGSHSQELLPIAHCGLSSGNRSCTPHQEPLGVQPVGHEKSWGDPCCKHEFLNRARA